MGSKKININSEGKSFESSRLFAKKIAFNILLLTLSVLLFFVLELSLSFFNYGNDLSLFVKSANYPGHFEINRNITLRYFSKVGNTSPTADVFLENKPDSCFRIFVFGGSTTRGYPYQEGTSFPRILYYRLQDAFPNKRIEVVNLSASAINSYSYTDMMDEVLKNKPDAILIYGGHNEYYGALGVASVENGGNVRWLKKLNLRLCKFRSYQLVQNIIVKFTSLSNKQTNTAPLMERIVKNKYIVYNSALYKKGCAQFESNMVELAEKAQNKNVPLILSELVCNVNDLPPFNTANDTINAEAHRLFNLANYYLSSDDTVRCKTLLYRAKDYDAIRFRAPEEFNAIIHKISNAYELPVVLMQQIFEQKSTKGLIGNNLMIDHLHPNIEGYFLMADAFYTSIINSQLIGNKPAVNGIAESDYYRNNWGFTALDSLIGDLNIKYLKSGWPFQQGNQGEVFLKTYKPKGVIDSMAFAYLTSADRHIENEHIKLAKYYASKGLYNNAYKEYLSLIKMHPYIADLYYDASKYLIEQHKYEQAYQLIYKAPNITKNYFYYYMLGTLSLKIQAYDRAIQQLVLSYEMANSNEKSIKILVPLYYAYQNVGNMQGAQKTLDAIRVNHPDFGKKRQNDPMDMGKDLLVKSILLKAESNIKIKNFKLAKAYLDTAMQMDTSFQTYYLNSLLYLLQHKNEQAYRHTKKAYEMDPTHYENLNNLFILELMKNDLEKASKLLDELRIINPDYEKMQRLESMFNKKENALVPK